MPVDVRRLYDQMNEVIGNRAPSGEELDRRASAFRGAAEALSRRAAETQEDARRLGNITVEEEDLTPWLRRAFPALSDTEAAQLNSRYLQERQARISEGRLRHYADQARANAGRGNAQTAISAVPIGGTVNSLMNNVVTARAARRIREGQGTEEDYRTLGQVMGDAERRGNQGVGRQIIDTIAGSVGFLGEIALTGGLGAGARAGGARVLGQSLVGRLGAGAIGRTAQVAPTVAMRGTAGTAERLIPSTDASVPEPTLGRAAYEGYVESAIEGLSEFASGPITRGLRAMPGVGRVFRALTPSSTGALGRVGFHGVLGEIFEERIAELGHGLTGVHRRPDGSADYGVSGNIVRGTGAAFSGEWQRARAEFGEAASQLSIEGGAFGIMGAAGWLFAGRARGHRNLPNGPQLMTMPVLDDFADPNQVRRQRFDQQGKPLPQMTLAQQYERASQAVALRNYAETQRWLRGVPAAELDQWVGAFGVTAEDVAQRREHDRLVAEAAEAGSRDGQVPQELRAELAQSEQNLQERAAELSQTMQTELREVQTTLLDSQEGRQMAQESTQTPQEAQVTSEPIQTPPEAQNQAPQEGVTQTNETVQTRQHRRHWLQAAAIRMERESLGEVLSQELVERTDEAGLTPLDLVNEFFEKAYPHLPQDAKDEVHRVLKGRGFEPGDVYGTRSDGTTIFVNNWRDIAAGEVEESKSFADYIGEGDSTKPMQGLFLFMAHRLNLVNARELFGDSPGMQLNAASTPQIGASVPKITHRPRTGKRTWYHSGTKFEGNRFGDYEIETMDVPQTEAYPDGGMMLSTYDAEGKEVGRLFVRKGKGGAVTVHGVIGRERGVARAMHDWVTENIGPVTPAADQSAEGKEFWRKNQEHGAKTKKRGRKETRWTITGKQPPPKKDETRWTITGTSSTAPAEEAPTPVEEQTVQPSQHALRFVGMPAEAAERAILEAFPNATRTPTGEITILITPPSTGKKPISWEVTIDFGAGANNAFVDFVRRGTEGTSGDVSKELGRGSVYFGKELGRLLIVLKNTGTAISYKATDSNRIGNIRVERAEIYARGLRKAGYVQTGGPGVDVDVEDIEDAIYVWKPAATPSAAPTNYGKVVQTHAQTKRPFGETPSPFIDKNDPAYKAIAETLNPTPVVDAADVDPVVNAAVDMMMGEVPRGMSEAKFTANILNGLTAKQKAAVDFEWARRINANTTKFQSERAQSGDGYAFEAASLEERRPKGGRRTDRRRGRTGQYFSEGAPTLGASGPAAEGGPISTHRIIANASVRFGVPYYIQNVYKKAEGVYAVRPRAILMHGMAAGNAPVFMHEVAHDIDTKLNLFPDVSAVRQLPKAVQDGLFEFDYAPQEHDEGTSAAEGFAEYIRMLVTQSLPRNMSTNQQAAAAYLESRLKSEPGLWEKLEDTADDFSRFVNMTPTEQAASNISVTGVAEPAELQPTLPNGQPVSEGSAALMRDFRAKWEDDTIALQAYEAAAEAGGHVWKIKPSEVVFILRSATQRAAAEMLENGVYAPQYGPTGEVIRRQQLGPRGLEAEVLNGLTAADRAPINGGVSRFETYFIARAIRDEVAKGRPNVGVDKQEMYARAWDEMQQDPAFIARAEPAAQRFTAAFNAMIDARVVAQIITPAEGERLKEKYPFYAPFARVPEASNWMKRLWNKVSGKGEALSTGLKARKGSDLPIMSPIKTYMARLNFLAALLAEQTKRMAVIGAFKTPGMMPGQERIKGMGGWMLEIEQPVVPHRTMVDNLQVAELLKKMGVEADVISDILEMPVSESELLYFTRSPVPVNGKPTLVVLEQGQPHFYRVGDQMMYDLLVGNNQIPEAAPLWLIRQANLLVKFGATAASHTFQLANIPRDMWTFARNTSDIKSAKDVPWAIIQAYSYFIYKASGMSRADLAKYHPLMTIYLSEGGEFTRKFSFDEPGIEKRYRDLMGQHGISHVFDWGKDKFGDILRIMGAAEHAPRVTEVGNYLRRQGYTEEDIAKHAAQGDVIPEYEIMKAMVAAAEVTTPFNRLGYKTRWLNLYISFFGPQIAGLSKGIRQTYANPKRVAGMAAYGLVLEILHYLANRDEDFYRNLDDYQRNRWYVFRVGNVLIRFPKSRELETLGINGFQQVLRAMDDNNPRFGGWLEDVVDQLTPPLLPAGFGTGLQIAMNRDWRGAPIVPRADENLPYWSRERFGRQLGYAAEQLTGGTLSPARARLTPFVLTSVPSQSVQDLYAARQTLSEQRNAWGREHRIGDEADYSSFPREQEHARINTYNRLFTAIARDRSAARGQERTAIDEARVAMASAVMGYRDSSMPSLASIPTAIRPEVEEWLGGVLRTATDPRDPDTQRRPRETPQEFRERSRRADQDRERDRATARAIIQEWNLPQQEQERLLRERLRSQGYGGEAIGSRLGRLRAR